MQIRGFQQLKVPNLHDGDQNSVLFFSSFMYFLFRLMYSHNLVMVWKIMVVITYYAEFVELSFTLLVLYRMEKKLQFGSKE